MAPCPVTSVMKVRLLRVRGPSFPPPSRSLLPFLSLFSKAPSGSGAGESTGYSKTNSFLNPGERQFFFFLRCSKSSPCLSM